MAHHNNPDVDDVVTTIINDGNGSQCGMSYEKRCNAARVNDEMAFRVAVRIYDQKRQKLGAAALTTEERGQASLFLLHYYTEHNRECDNIKAENSGAS